MSLRASGAWRWGEKRPAASRGDRVAAGTWRRGAPSCPTADRIVSPCGRGRESYPAMGGAGMQCTRMLLISLQRGRRRNEGWFSNPEDDARAASLVRHGAGARHRQTVEAAARLGQGIDVTRRAIDVTRRGSDVSHQFGGVTE